MKSVIKAVIAVVVLAGAAGAAEYDSKQLKTYGFSVKLKVYSSVRGSSQNAELKVSFDSPSDYKTRGNFPAKNIKFKLVLLPDIEHAAYVMENRNSGDYILPEKYWGGSGGYGRVNSREASVWFKLEPKTNIDVRAEHTVLDDALISAGGGFYGARAILRLHPTCDLELRSCKLSSLVDGIDCDSRGGFTQEDAIFVFKSDETFDIVEVRPGN